MCYPRNSFYYIFLHFLLAYDNSQKSEDKAIHLFGQQNLSDCGLRDSVLKKFCSANTTAFDSVKYTKDDGYFIS